MRIILCAAAAAACLALAAPAQARIADSGLATAAPGAIQDAHYTGYYHRHRARYRHCWNHRVRVWVRGHYVWRTVRRCDWRYR